MKSMRNIKILFWAFTSLFFGINALSQNNPEWPLSNTWNKINCTFLKRLLPFFYPFAFHSFISFV